VKLLLATRSAHKVAEIRRIFSDIDDVEVVDLTAAGIAPDPAEEDLEPFDTFLENAASKARYFQGKSGLPTVADDSGLEVDALDGAPGVRSKRFAPIPDEVDGLPRDQANNEYLLERLGDLPLPRRTARYVCVAVLDEGEGRTVSFRGEAPGLILARPRGKAGFGYDPLFFDEQLGKTFAEIERAEKNARSHRGKAFQALARHLADRGR
jgi:XTP/dITP diphosphohydrolase